MKTETWNRFKRNKTLFNQIFQNKIRQSKERFRVRECRPNISVVSGERVSSEQLLFWNKTNWEIISNPRRENYFVKLGKHWVEESRWRGVNCLHIYNNMAHCSYPVSASSVHLSSFLDWEVRSNKIWEKKSVWTVAWGGLEGYVLSRAC